MKINTIKFFIATIVQSLLFQMAAAQTDTMYFMKGGYILHRQSISPMDVDSAIFYYPGPGSIIKIPAVKTVSYFNVKPYSASCNGLIINNNGSMVSRKGICWDTVTNPSIAKHFTDDIRSGDSILVHLSNLKPATRYYFRAYAINKKGISYGENQDFITDSVFKPTLKIENIRNIIHNSAEIKVQITDDGGAPLMKKGICWSRYGTPTADSNSYLHTAHNNNFTGLAEKLAINTTYFVRAYASNSMGISYSSVNFFTTLKSTDTANIIWDDSLLNEISYHQTSYLYSTKITFPKLKMISGQLYLYQCNNIVEVNLPELSSIASYCYFDKNLHLNKIYAPKLKSIFNYIYLSGNTNLIQVNMCQLSDIFCKDQEPYIYINSNHPSLNTSCFSGVKLNGTVILLDPVNNFSNNTAIVDATLTTLCENGGSYRAIWGLSPNPMPGLNEKNCIVNNGKLSCTITGLLPGTKYYVRIYKSSGNIFSNELSFTTAP